MIERKLAALLLEIDHCTKFRERKILISDSSNRDIIILLGIDARIPEMPRSHCSAVDTSALPHTDPSVVKGFLRALPGSPEVKMFAGWYAYTFCPVLFFSAGVFLCHCHLLL